MFSWKKWRKRRRLRRRVRNAPTSLPSLASRDQDESTSTLAVLSSNSQPRKEETVDEFLLFFRQFRADKEALPEGWLSQEDACSRDSGRSSGELTEDSPVASIARHCHWGHRPPLWLDKRHFFNRSVDEASDYSYCSAHLSTPREEEEREEEDSGVSSLATQDAFQRQPTLSLPPDAVQGPPPLRQRRPEPIEVWDASQHMRPPLLPPSVPLAAESPLSPPVALRPSLSRGRQGPMRRLMPYGGFIIMLVLVIFMAGWTWSRPQPPCHCSSPSVREPHST